MLTGLQIMYTILTAAGRDIARISDASLMIGQGDALRYRYSPGMAMSASAVLKDRGH